METTSPVSVIGIDPSFTGFAAYGIGSADRAEHTLWIGTKPKEGMTDAESTEQRCNEIVAAFRAHLEKTVLFEFRHLWYVEAPMLKVPAHGGSHLYQMGWLMSRLYFDARVVGASIIEVPNATLLKTLFGKGRIPHTELPLLAYKRFGVTFEGDRNLDRLFAYLLFQYGMAVESGRVHHVASRTRGTKHRKARPAPEALV